MPSVLFIKTTPADLPGIREYVHAHIREGDPVAMVWFEMLTDVDYLDAVYSQEEFNQAAQEALAGTSQELAEFQDSLNG